MAKHRIPMIDPTDPYVRAALLVDAWWSDAGEAALATLKRQLAAFIRREQRGQHARPPRGAPPGRAATGRGGPAAAGGYSICASQEDRHSLQSGGRDGCWHSPLRGKCRAAIPK